jgi:hypothetical protein
MKFTRKTDLFVQHWLDDQLHAGINNHTGRSSNRKIPFSLSQAQNTHNNLKGIAATGEKLHTRCSPLETQIKTEEGEFLRCCRVYVENT